MFTLRRVTNNWFLISRLMMGFYRKARPSIIPTQNSIMLPYSINYLHDNPGHRRIKKKVGRGPGSGKGKTAGRGHKGHKARQGGGVNVRFEGGQTPICRRLPKYGRVKQTRPFQLLDYVNLGTIDYYVQRGILNPNEIITIKMLQDVGAVKSVKWGVKILSKGAQRINYALNLEVTDASVSSIQRIKEFGGSVSLVYRTRLKLRQHLYPEKYPIPLGEPITPNWRLMKLKRKQQAKGLKIKYNKPKWLLEQQQKNQEMEKDSKQFNFEYPAIRRPNSGKIRKRKPEIFRTISYEL